MNEFLTKNPDVALIEIKEKIYERLAFIRQVKHDFHVRSKHDPEWAGIVGQCGNEEKFLADLLDLIERS